METQGDAWESVLAAFGAGGGDIYVGEAVTQLEHALQAAALADSAGASDELVIAALLHDIGHLLHGLGEDIAIAGVDARHEIASQGFLSTFFGPEVSEPARLHVAAKRYLCATEEGYHAGLSSASRLSLELQGGVMSPEEAIRFAESPHGETAARLRRWDDQAKVVGLSVPGLDSYADRIRALADQKRASPK